MRLVATSAPALNNRVVLILEAACRVVMREGAHGLRMTSVAHEAGVSKALLHYYFSTRQELLRSAFAFSDERWREALDRVVATLATGAERLDRLLLSSIDPDPPFGDQRALWNEVWSSLRFDDELRPLVERSYRRWIEQVTELIEAGRADGSIALSVDAGRVGWRLAATGDGLDSMLYLGLLDRQSARELMLGSIRSEFAAP